jgi:D-alanyl-D-alanine dipeptidase
MLRNRFFIFICAKSIPVMYNIVIRLHFLCFVYTFFCVHVTAQDTVKSTLPVIKDTEQFRRVVSNDSSQQLIRLDKLVPNIRLDLRYADKNNFTGKRLYPKALKITFLRKAPAEALREVATELEKQGLGLKIFDAYRPYSATVEMWDLIRDERYVANPMRGSGHNRGLSVDLTLYYMRNGKELAMGTGFDNFTEAAHHDNPNLPEKVLINRGILKSVMEKHGFQALDTEWWHYSWPNNRKYDVLDLSFEEVNRFQPSPLRQH